MSHHAEGDRVPQNWLVEEDQGAMGSQSVQPIDYSKGPSALDKAAQLFFFTEIVRGE